MSSALMSIAGLMFGIPLALMIVIAGLGGEIPSFILWAGGWSMALGVVLGGIGAAIAAMER